MQIKSIIILFLFFSSSCMVTSKFLTPKTEGFAEESFAREAVASFVAAKESPLHASQGNSAWEVFLWIMLLVAGACAFSKYDSIKIKTKILLKWIEGKLEELKKSLTKKDD